MLKLANSIEVADDKKLVYNNSENNIYYTLGFLLAA
jgi:hypothetical protein